MTLDELVDNTREDILMDLIPDAYLWSDKQLLRYAKEACLEACKRAPLINATHTKSVIVARASYDIDEEIRQIKSIILTSTTDPLTQTTDYEIQLMYGPQWRNNTGTPTHYIRTNHALLLYPIPEVADSITLYTTDRPDEFIYLDDEFDSSYHQALQYWIAHRAYQKNDANTFNSQKAIDYLAMFNAKFGEPKSARLEQFAFNNPMYGTIISGRMA